MPAKYTVLRTKKGKRLGRARSGTMVNLDKPTKTAVAKIAKTVIRKAQELKYVGQLYDNEPYELYGSTIPTGAAQAQVFECLPDLQEGTSEFKRIGVKVMPSRHVVDLDLRFNTRMAAINVDRMAWDINVHIWFGFIKRYKYAVDVLANTVDIANNLLEDGQGNTVPWDGSPYKSYLSLNKEVNTLKHKVVRMYRPLGAQNTADGVQQTYFPQNIHQKVRLTFKPPKALLYNENNQVPENYAPVVIIGYEHNDASQASNAVGGVGVLGIPALTMMMQQHLWFRDA